MSIGPILPAAGLPPMAVARPATTPTPAAGFAERVGDAFDQLQVAQGKASSSAKAWELGIENDLAAVMIDQQVASLGFQLALNVRNKALGAYRDIMNMPL